MLRSFVVAVVSTVGLVLLNASCSNDGASLAPSIRLVDLVRPEAFSDSDAAPAAPEPEALLPVESWKAGPGVEGLTVRDGKLFGRTTDENPVIYAALPEWSDPADSVDSLELDISIGSGERVRASVGGGEEADPGRALEQLQDQEHRLEADIVASLGMQTVRLPYGGARGLSDSQFVYLAPSDVAGAEFEIESARLVTTKERLAETPSGVGWHGLADIFRESIVAHAPEVFEIEVTVPSGAWLDINLGVLDGRPVKFEIFAESDENPLLARTVTTPKQWRPVAVDLSELGGRTLGLKFSLNAAEDNVVGLWGTPIIRVPEAEPAAPAEASSLLPDARPRNVIFVQADTLRRDHLPFYGYQRDTAPTIARLVSEGVLFTDNVSPASWTKVATPSIVTGLYPTAHTVSAFSDRLPASAKTIAELYRSAGYATLAYSSVTFTGKFTNLHQGYDELHESGSKADDSPKSSREYVDRLTGWIDRHPDTPFFAFLHVFDPHSPFEPRSPYNARWADPAKRQDHLAEIARLEPHATEFNYRQQLATIKNIKAAGVDPDALMAYHQDWYDGSILGMDTEMGRLIESLEQHGVREDTLIVFFSDHGEEFLEHGGVFHAHSIYGELTNVPLFFHWPAGLPGSVVIDETVRSIDIMPTVLEMSRLESPDGMQGQSLLPLIAAARDRPEANAEQIRAAAEQLGWSPALAVSENVTELEDRLRATAITDGEWRLIHNTYIPENDIPEYERAEYELFRHRDDPLNLRNVAEDHPEVVERLKRELDSWRENVETGKLSQDDATEGLSAAEIERLKSLGYVQ